MQQSFDQLLEMNIEDVEIEGLLPALTFSPALLVTTFCAPIILIVFRTHRMIESVDKSLASINSTNSFLLENSPTRH